MPFVSFKNQAIFPVLTNFIELELNFLPNQLSAANPIKYTKQILGLNVINFVKHRKSNVIYNPPKSTNTDHYRIAPHIKNAALTQSDHFDKCYFTLFWPIPWWRRTTWEFEGVSLVKFSGLYAWFNQRTGREHREHREVFSLIYLTLYRENAENLNRY